MTFKAFWDNESIVTAELDLIYYSGLSESFMVTDEKNNHFIAEIISCETINFVCRYKLKVRGLEIGKSYTLSDERFLRTPICYRYIVRSNYFDENFTYNGSDLGPSYSEKKTTFRVWTPLSSRAMVDIEGFGTYEMTRKDKGIFEAIVPGDLDRALYQYLTCISGQWRSANDPYAYSSSSNNRKSAVVDPEKFIKDLKSQFLPELKQKTDAVIYEIHIRDFSSDNSSGIKGSCKFSGLTETGTVNSRGDSTGLDYLSDLGITHVQLMPVYDFGSVDETDQMSHYNWGYDPVQFNVPEGSYSSDSSDPYSRIQELQEMISAIHSKGLRIVMDVVYNHVFDRFSSDFEKLVPGYYFRIGEDGQQSNGSFCGNDFDSTKNMSRKYILESVKRWMTIYSMDGFRFDLMGILDIETMNQIEELVRSTDKNAIIYGEGWNMPTLLDESRKATIMNQDKMPGISHFNDYFRDTIKGDTMTERVKHKGLFTGDTRHLERLPGLLLGSRYDAHGSPFFSSPEKSINYVECHDNHTVFDKMLAAGIKERELIPRQKLMLAAVIFSRGIPFIHAGQEMCRTKGGDHNSYKSPDKVNRMDWNRRSEYKELVKFVKDAITLRQETAIFRASGYDENTKIRTDKHHKLMELIYSDGTALIINLGPHGHKINLKNQKIVFNSKGKTDISGNVYEIDKLELIIIK